MHFIGRRMNVSLCLLLVLNPLGLAELSGKRTQLGARFETMRGPSRDIASRELSRTQLAPRFKNKLHSYEACRHIHGVLLQVRGGDSAFDASMSSSIQPKLHLAGKLLPALKDTLKLGPNAGAAMNGILDVALFSDWIIIASIWAGSYPALRLIHRGQNFARSRKGYSVVRFETTLAWALAQSLKALSLLLMALYGIDILTVICAAFHLPLRSDLPTMIATMAKPVWLYYTLSKVKEWGLGVMPAQLEENFFAHPRSLVASRLELVSTGRRLVYNRFCDVILGVAAFVTSLDALSVDIGVALTSLLAVGGLGSVIVALACKEPLAHFISGLMVTFSDKFMVGDAVLIGKGVAAGVVTAMGWFDTSIRGSDETTAVVPNSKIAGEIIVNLSRATLSQYKTDLRLPYEDLDKVEHVVESIRAALKKMAPAVVLPPVRNLEVVFAGFDKDAVLVSVNMKVRAPEGSPMYLKVRQEANVAIAQAVANCGSSFALPSSRKVSGLTKLSGLLPEDKVNVTQ